MTNDEMIDYSIKELNNCEKLYIMFKDLSFLKGVYEYDDNFRKIKYMLSNAEPFEKHGDHAIKFSKIGFNIIYF